MVASPLIARRGTIGFTYDGKKKLFTAVLAVGLVILAARSSLEVSN